MAGTHENYFGRKYNWVKLIFQKEEDGFDHQEATMPSVPPPEMVTNMWLPFQLKFFLYISVVIIEL